MSDVCRIRNPRTGETDYQTTFAGPKEIAQAVGALRENQVAWQASGVQKRSQALIAFADALKQQAPAMRDALIQDTGRYRESVMEVEGVVAIAQSWAMQAVALLTPQPPRPSLARPILIHIQKVPYPVVGVISPWNFPLLLSLIDSLVALMAGCAVLVKPSEVTPRFVEPLRAAIAASGLEGVFGVLVGDAASGAELCRQVDLVCFTGSLETGRKVSALAGQRMIPASLELGGKDAAIVFADADLERTAKALCWGGFTNAGQACQAIERVYVEHPAFEPLIAQLTACAKQLRLNDQDITVGEIGPIIAKRQIQIVQSQLEDAQSKGAKAILGGTLFTSGGVWCPPTLLVDVNHSMDVMQKETFATILPIMPFDTEEEALKLANDSVFGLSGAVFSQDGTRASRVASQMEAGAISINDCALTTQVFDGEKNAFKGSGLGGSRMGQASILRFIRHRALLENPEQTINSWWFPALTSDEPKPGG